MKMIVGSRETRLYNASPMKAILKLREEILKKKKEKKKISTDTSGENEKNGLVKPKARNVSNSAVGRSYSISKCRLA